MRVGSVDAEGTLQADPIGRLEAVEIGCVDGMVIIQERGGVGNWSRRRRTRGQYER